MRKRYAVVVEASGTSYGVHAPDVPGCVAVAETRDEALRQFADALAFHFAGMAEDGEAIPEPGTVVDYVEVELPAPAVAAG